MVFEKRYNAELQLRRAISIQAELKKGYLRSMLSRRQLQGFVMSRPTKRKLVVAFFPTRRVGMSLARPFKAGTGETNGSAVASATVEPSLTRR